VKSSDSDSGSPSHPSARGHLPRQTIVPGIGGSIGTLQASCKNDLPLALLYSPSHDNQVKHFAFSPVIFDIWQFAFKFAGDMADAAKIRYNKKV
jgi:hypothetical protein